jgi:hypothetical protein
MNASELKNLQTPLKEKYKEQPESALLTESTGQYWRRDLMQS